MNQDLAVLEWLVPRVITLEDGEIRALKLCPAPE
jgi:hypothetical protein